MKTQSSSLEIIADVIREHYDLGDVSVPRQLETTHQRRHQKLVVESTAGRFLVKTYQDDPVVLDALRFQHRLSCHLEQNGLPVAHIQTAKSGKCIVELPGWALELQSFLEGEQMSITTGSLTIAAKTLGKFHKVCEDLPVPPRDARMWRFSEVPRASFQQFYERAREESSEEKVMDQCNSIALFLRSAAEHLDDNHRKAFETGLIHGDWHGGNLLFRNERLAAILDLEFAGAGCYLEDLAYALSNLCIRTTVSDEKLYYRTNLLLDNYQVSRSLSYAELVALFYAVGVKHVTTVSYQLPLNDGEIAGYTSAQWMERLALQCKWLAEQSRKARWCEK